MYQRRILPQLPSLPGMPAPQPAMGRLPPQMIQPPPQQQEQRMPNVPVGLLDKMLAGSPQLTDGFLAAGMAPSGMDAAIASVAPDLGFSTPFLDSLMASGDVGLMDSLGTAGAFDLGTAGTGAGGLLGSAGAAGESGALGAGLLAGPVAPIAIGAMLAKPYLQDDNSDMSLLPAILHPNTDVLFSPFKFLGDLF